MYFKFGIDLFAFSLVLYAMHEFKKLNVWNFSIDLVTEIYKVTEVFPKTEMYGITNQMRRSAVSISSNISEGAGRKSKGEFLQFLSYANGSCYELETQLIISNKLKYIEPDLLNELLSKLSEIERMIYKLKMSISN